MEIPVANFSELHSTRKQLTLFVRDQAPVIEEVRRRFNPVQHKLIPAHVTLCREDEILEMDTITSNLERMKFTGPLNIMFGKVERFEDGKGVWLPAAAENRGFYELRSEILQGLHASPHRLRPHVTLMHPRNSACTDNQFNQIKEYALPSVLCFDLISLVEQTNGGPWQTLMEFKISRSAL